MSWNDIHVGDYGWVGQLVLRQDNVVVDISSYTTLQMVFIAPDGTVTTKTASFGSDGTDGVVQYSIEDGLIDAAGDWQVFARVSSGGIELTTTSVRFSASPRLDA